MELVDRCIKKPLALKVTLTRTRFGNEVKVEDLVYAFESKVGVGGAGFGRGL
jgi:hypothetical protein